MDLASPGQVNRVRPWSVRLKASPSDKHGEMLTPFYLGLCSSMTNALLRSRMRTFGYCSTAASNAAWATLPQRDCQPVEVGGDDQSGLAARQREHRAVLIGQHDRARAGGPDRGAHAARGIDTINIRRPSDVADGADEIGH